MDEIKLIIDNVAAKEDAKTETLSSKFKNISLGIAGIISSILIPIVGYMFTQNQNDKEIQKSYIELGIKILTEHPKKGTVNVRDYAVNLINKYSDVKLEGEAKNDIINNVPIFATDGNFSQMTPKEILSTKSRFGFASDKPLGFDVSQMASFLDSTTIMQTKIQFVFIKATEGENFVDLACKKNVKLAKEYNLLYSLYHFFKINASAEKQASNFNAAFNKYGSTLPLCLDLEWQDSNIPIDKNKYIDSVLKFISLLKIPRKNDLIIFTAPSFAKMYLDSRFSKYKLAVMQYSQEYNPNDGIPGIWSKANYWQFLNGNMQDLIVSND